ncbi:putative baseplate assembly protein [Actinoplanes hulinensis]|uniref:Baseplate assembly protein n=1 Tax=Actinoplanes hulinensis TaxID=1144547 RepID=A0ABS7B2D9_9ACTN|nr:putative baseplate assembly protein [Actinoplanes hulinensis]MBW6435150.1 putative baseplate assembly protein [Actinoplanes hulinensis]
MSDRRRAAIRAAGHNGVDEVEVSDDGLRLSVTFLGRAPDDLEPGNVRIDGGRRITGVTAVAVEVEHADDPELDDRLHVTVDRAGDTSRYRLSIVEPDLYGRPGDTPYPGFDQRYLSATFRFRPQCPAPFEPPEPEPMSPPAPVIDYTARDYDTIRRLLLDRMALTIPAWVERGPVDLGVALVELLAYTADQISYQQDAVATEAYLDTARHRVSVRRHTRLIDYPMHDGANARVVVVVDVAEPVTLRPGEYRFAAAGGHRGSVIEDENALIFEPLDRRPARLWPEHNAIRFWTWEGDQPSLPAGATAATLRDDDRCLRLRPGDVLVLEETRGHRQAVRLLSATPGTDRLSGQTIVEVTWADEDALTHGLDLDESVARGNAILADHGRTVPVTTSGPRWVTQAVPYPLPAHVCAGQAAHLAGIPDRARERLTALWRSAGDRTGLSDTEVDELTVLFDLSYGVRTALREEPVRTLRHLLHRADRLLAAKRRRLDVLAARARAGTILGDHVAEEIAQTWGDRYADGLRPGDPVLAGPISALAGDPAQALPALRGDWKPRRDLLDSGPRDRHVVGELTDDGRLRLRFNTTPPPGTEIGYRIGGGTAGNVGAEAITHLVTCRDDGGIPAVTGVRNPLPAVGGADPEPVDRVRRLAPLDLRRKKRRAITAADYAELASALPGVQRAAAEIRWTGGTAEAHVAIDARGSADPSQRLLDEVADRLEAYRRIGHDLVVTPARPVPLDIVVEVCAAPGHQHGRILADLHRKLLAAFRPDALTFGDPVRVSRLTALAASVPGVRTARVTRLRRLSAPDAGELAAGLLRLGPLEVARCDNDPDRPENGRLETVLTEEGD